MFNPFEKEEVPAPWIESMPEVSMFPVVEVERPTPRPVETVSWEVEAWVVEELVVKDILMYHLKKNRILMMLSLNINYFILFFSLLISVILIFF